MPSDTTRPEPSGRAALFATAAPVARRDEPRRRKPLPPVPSCLRDDMLLTAKEAAAVARIGISTFWLRVKEGRFPKPSYAIGPKSPRWRLRDLRAALEGAA